MPASRPARAAEAAAAAAQPPRASTSPVAAMAASKRPRVAAASSPSPLALYRQALRLVRQSVPGTAAGPTDADAEAKLCCAIAALEPECEGCTGAVRTLATRACT